MNKKKTSILLAYATLYIVWGSTYFAIKAAVETIPPFYVVGLRFIIGGPLLLLFCWLGGRIKPLPTRQEILTTLLLGVLLLVGGSGLVTVGETKVDSYLTALIISATPIVVAFYDLVLLKKKIPPMRLGGILIGILGVGLLLYNGRSFASSLSPEVLIIFGGVACWGLATSLGHTLKVYHDPLVNSAIQMSVIGLACMVCVLIFLPSPAEIWPQVSLQSGLALLYLAVVGSLAFASFTYLVANEPATRVVSYSLVNPVIATLLGLLVGGESPAPLLALGLPLVLLGVTLMLYGEHLLLWLKRYFVKVEPAVDR